MTNSNFIMIVESAAEKREKTKDKMENRKWKSLDYYYEF